MRAGRRRIGILIGSSLVLALLAGCTQAGTTASRTASTTTSSPPSTPITTTSPPSTTTTNVAAITGYVSEVKADLSNASVQLQTIHNAPTAIVGDAAAAITASGTQGAGQLQQDEGLASPSSPQAQQLTQCDQSAGSDEAAIQTCVQQYSQNFANPVQSDAASFAQMEAEVQAQLATASAAFTSLGTAWTSESSQLGQLRLPPSAESSAATLASAYATIESDCTLGEQAASTPITSLGLAYSTSLAVAVAGTQLSRDSATWAGDFQDFENAVAGS